MSDCHSLIFCLHRIKCIAHAVSLDHSTVGIVIRADRTRLATQPTFDTAVVLSQDERVLGVVAEPGGNVAGAVGTEQG